MGKTYSQQLTLLLFFSDQASVPSTMILQFQFHIARSLGPSPVTLHVRLPWFFLLLLPSPVGTVNWSPGLDSSYPAVGYTPELLFTRINVTKPPCADQSCREMSPSSSGLSAFLGKFGQLRGSATFTGDH
jgi:hypothetical protein